MKKTKNRKKCSAATAANGAVHMNQGGIAYQNKDITSKLLAENFKGKTFRVYGLDIPEVKAVLPTNIPSVRANELRLPWRKPCAGSQHRSYLPRPKQASALLMRHLCGQFLQHGGLHPAKD